MAVNRRERTRRSYYPEELRVLFIGESPPTGGTFFYDANSILYQATREAFMAAAPKLAAEADFLAAFRRMGCYLDDLSRVPIDKLPDAEKRIARKEAVPGLARRLRGLEPRVVVIVVKGIEPQVTKALNEAGLAEVTREPLPFPGQWHRSAYIGELAALVRSWRRRWVLLPVG
jgi:hypothetical protein